jgi:hypothetical protein
MGTGRPGQRTSYRDAGLHHLPHQSPTISSDCSILPPYSAAMSGANSVLLQLASRFCKTWFSRLLIPVYSWIRGLEVCIILRVAMRVPAGSALTTTLDCGTVSLGCSYCGSLIAASNLS